ncbi:MAG: T9SS type A sorting domain-containing protein [Chitinophagaceae bacterium]|nr:T9SS type A sorting domain-containing protein [Chitinophagaceae bacterium]
MIDVQNAKSQCTISDLKVRLIEVNTSNCELTLDLSWTQEINNGNKYAYLHLWTQSGYHTPAVNWVNMYSNPNAFPKAADLVNAIATIVINNNSADNPLVGSVYHPDPLYILPQLTGLTAVKVHLNPTLERMTIKNIKLTLPSCTGAQTILFDAWASQAANGKNVHCATQGANLIINEVKPGGLLSCLLPRQFQVILQNTGPVLDNIWYDVHLDYPPIGIINTDDTVVYTSGLISLSANGNYISPVTDYLPYSNRIPSANLPLIVELTIPNRPNTTTALIENGCGPLPVNLVLFTATAGKNKIMLRWQTSTEHNNRGFEIERQYLDGDFKTIAFVPSKSISGNSGQYLDYLYDDYEYLSGKGNLFYRIKQIDLDGNYTYSETRLVRSETAMSGVLVYPNPSTGSTRIILPEGTGLVDIILSDLSGKEIFRRNNVTDLLQLDKLVSGMYLIRVFVKTTGEVQVKKLIVL